MSFTRRDFLKFSVGSAALSQTPAAIAKAASQTTVPRRRFGRHSDLLSVVGIGGHTLYLSGSQKEATEIVSRAFDQGINFYENAWDYHDGEAESYMGNALEGKREKVFLMTKYCNFHQGKEKATVAEAMKHLEDSLRRLKTDYLDLWMLHNVSGNDAEDAYKQDGAIEAMELAKQQGKIRYTGFTGHTETKVHIDLIKGGYAWDATLMPVSIVGALKSRAFEREVMPLCEEKQIAVLGMKGFGGSRRTQLHSQTNVQEVLQYSLSYPQVCTHVVGIDKLEYVEQAIVASSAQPWTPDQRSAYAQADARPGTSTHAASLMAGKYYEAGCSHHRPEQA